MLIQKGDYLGTKTNKQKNVDKGNIYSQQLTHCKSCPATEAVVSCAGPQRPCSRRMCQLKKTQKHVLLKSDENKILNSVTMG